MILSIQGSERHLYPGVTDAMYRIRAKVFDERLGWDVRVVDGREIDAFDDIDPLYLVSVDERTRRVRGSLRLLRTTGPNMLRDVFQQLMPGEVVESATIWESSRFSLDPDAADDQVGRLSSFTTELLCGIVEAGLRAGLTFVVSVYDARMARIFRAADCPAEIVGTPMRIGRVMTYAGLFEISQTMWDRIARTGGITGPVLAPPSVQHAWAA